MNLKKNYIKFGVNGVTNKEDFINEIATEADAIIQKHINANNTKNIDLLNEVENECSSPKLFSPFLTFSL